MLYINKCIVATEKLLEEWIFDKAKAEVIFSIGFYKSWGAVPMDEWTTYRITDDTLVKFAEE